MRILGIDPGLHICGYACVDVDRDGEKLIEAGVFRTDENQPLEERLNRIAEDIGTILKNLRPDIVAVEQLYSHYEHPRTAILMGHARGVILQKCAESGIEVKSFNPTRIKKAVTGSGRAKKEQVQRTIQTVFGLRELPQPPDVADAIAIALCCANSIAGGKIA
jgi:crossover junction endodeoxyribonuclease RuvC